MIKKNMAVKQLSTIVELWAPTNIRGLDSLELILEILAAKKLIRQDNKSGLAVRMDVQTLIQALLRLNEQIDLPEAPTRINELPADFPFLLEKTSSDLNSVLENIDQGQTISVANYISLQLSDVNRSREIRHKLMQSKLNNLYPLLAELIGKATKERIYIPYDSSAWLAVLIAEHGGHVDCDVRHLQTARILRLATFILNWDMELKLGDSLTKPVWIENEKLKLYSKAAAMVTFGLRLKDKADEKQGKIQKYDFLYGEWQQIAHLLSQTTERVVVIVSEPCLTRSAGSERDYKDDLIRRGVVQAVIKLPSYFLSPLAVRQASILILNNKSQKQSKVLFVDPFKDDANDHHNSKTPAIDKEFTSDLAKAILSGKETANSRLASYEEIATNDFNISVDRYVLSDQQQEIEKLLENHETVELGDVAEIIRPQSHPQQGAASSSTWVEVGLKDIQRDGTISHPEKVFHIDDHSASKLRRLSLIPGDILLSIRGRIGEVAIIQEWIEDAGHNGWVAAQAFVIIRLKKNSKLDSVTLYQYLTSSIGQGLIQSMNTATTVPMLSIKDVKKLRVILPSTEDMKSIVKEHNKLNEIYTKIKDLDEKVEEIKASSWPINLMKK